MKKTLKNTIKETRELMNKINKFLSEDYNIIKKAANDFMIRYSKELENILGQNWQKNNVDWLDDYEKTNIIHDMVWEFVTQEYPNHMGDEEKSENFVQNVMFYIK